MLNRKIVKICEQKFTYLNYSKRTKDNYLSHIKKRNYEYKKNALRKRK